MFANEINAKFNNSDYKIPNFWPLTFVVSDCNGCLLWIEDDPWLRAVQDEGEVFSSLKHFIVDDLHADAQHRLPIGSEHKLSRVN